MTDEKTRALIAGARRMAPFYDKSGTLEVARMLDSLADALSALTLPDGDVRERLRKVVARGAFEDFADYPLDGENALVERVTDAILAAFPLPSRDIAGEIQAERLDTDHDAIGADAYINGLIRAEEIVRNGR